MRVVVKVGTSTLTHQTGRLNIKRVEALCRVLSDLKNVGHEILLVSSGAIGMGVGKLMLTEKPKDIQTKQACAAVGQCELMYVYDNEFAKYNHNIAQILITSADIETETNHLNFQNTISRLLEFEVLPIINENDTVSTKEIAIGDNDTLSAIVAVSIEADLLVLLTDIDGLYDMDPNKHPEAKLISKVYEITPEIEAMGEGSGTQFGTGGMHTKLIAAKIATQEGIDMIIANSTNPEVLYDIFDGLEVGTKFFGKGK